jgi:hypothetical protein
VLASVEPAGVGVLLVPVGARLDIAAVDPDGWRAEKPGLLGRLLVGDLDQSQLGVAAELCLDSLHQRQGGVAVGAAHEGQHLDEGPRAG